MQTAQTEPRERDRADIKEFTHAEITELHERFDELNRQVADLTDALKKERERSDA